MVAVVHQIRWIGKDEVHAVGWQLAHLLDAVAMQEGVDGNLLCDGLDVHDGHSVCVVSRWAGAHCAERRERVRLPRSRNAFGEGPEESFRAL